MLLVDDDEDIREIVAEVLAAHGYSVRVARNGLEALNALDSVPLPPRLILLDMMMPVMNGWQLLTILRDHPAHSRIPVVVMTASGLHPLNAEPNGWLAKPVDHDRLVEAVAEFAGPIRPVHDVDQRISPDLVEHFLLRCRRDIERLLGALASRDYEEMHRVAHGLQGVGAAFGFPKLTPIGASLERAVSDADEAAMLGLIEDMADYLGLSS